MPQSAVKKTNPLVDGDDATHYSFAMKGNDNKLELNFKAMKKFNVLMLQENIRVGQRVEQFVFEYWSNGKWNKATEGTTIGYKRLLEFPTISATKVRLRILSARLQPALAEIGLYFYNNDKQ
jgi:alpha-L-fucosidase